MTDELKQIFEIDTASGTEEVPADSYHIVDIPDPETEGQIQKVYKFFNGSELVRTVPVDDILWEYDESGEQTSGIKTVLSRSAI